MVVAERARNPFHVLKAQRNFRLFWSGQTLSLIGTWMQSMAQGWLALELTNSPFLVGLVASIGALPIVFFSLPAGVLVDRHDKLRLVTIGQALLATQALLLWWFVWTGHITIGWLLALAAMNGLVASLEIPARQSLIIELVGRAELGSAIALNSSGFNLARVIGPSVAGLVIARLGLAWCFGLNAMSYSMVLLSLVMIRLPRWVADASRPTAWAGFVEGLRYMRSTPEVVFLIRIVMAYAVLGVPFIALMPVIARDMLGTGAGGYGLLLGSVGAGGLAGALVLAGMLHRVPRMTLLPRACMAFAALLLALSFVRTPLLAYPILFGAGFSMIVNSAVANELLQTVVPDAMRGRVMALYALIVIGLSRVVGAFAGGVVADAVGIDWSIGASAALLLAFTAWIFSRRPAALPVSPPGDPVPGEVPLVVPVQPE
jgi:MFS family permease